ncbi:YC8E [Hepatospora eriocheir]|uniref:YC8E n=1 Tax=Hepatospora eriocheir TaxID=1081669 RepID=A0A1X0QJI1_9MICR|nr:YC8E [Hepatospora eriocheir]
MNKEKKEEFLEYLLSKPYNSKCAHCNKPSPSWASVTLGLFVCLTCAALHRKLGPTKSRIISLSLDNLNEYSLRRLYVGGNKNVKIFDIVDIFNNENNQKVLAKELDKKVEENEKNEPDETFMDKVSKDNKYKFDSDVKIEKKTMKKFGEDISSDNITEDSNVEEIKETSHGPRRVISINITTLSNQINNDHPIEDKATVSNKLKRSTKKINKSDTSRTPFLKK